MTDTAFLDRVFANLPRLSGRFAFAAWKHGGKPTSEGVGVLPESGADVGALVARIMDVGAYKGNIDYVAECRAISDPRFVPPEAVRFYQRVKVPMLAEIHHELVLTDHGDRDGWRVLGWHMLEAETERLNKKQGARSAYNVGGWLLKPDAVAYALSSSPRKEDVGRIKYAALTRGADAGASKVLQGNIAGMVRWSRR
jgi:hypothetical protein